MTTETESPSLDVRELSRLARDARANRQTIREQTAKNDDARVAAHRAAMLKARLRKSLNIDVDPTGSEITLDGIEFGILERDYGDALVVWTPCANCGAPLPSSRINDLADVGAVLAGEQIDRYHHCKAEELPTPEEPSTVERFVDILGQLLQERGWLGPV